MNAINVLCTKNELQTLKGKRNYIGCTIKTHWLVPAQLQALGVYQPPEPTAASSNESKANEAESKEATPSNEDVKPDAVQESL